MRVCGDWLFYLNIIRGGRIAYCIDTNDYYRIHEDSSSKKSPDTGDILPGARAGRLLNCQLI